MLSEDQKYTLKKNIPTSYIVKGKSFTPTVVYANQFQDNVFPAIVLNYVRKSEILYRPNDNILKIDKNYSQVENETLTATSSWDYDLASADIVITKIEGYYSGTPVEFTNYSIDHSTLTFISQKPDEGTDFIVTYTSNYYYRQLGGWLYDLLNIDVFVTRQQQVNPIIVVDAISVQLYKWFQYEANDYAKPENFLVLNLSEILNLDQLVQSEDQRRRQFTVALQHVETYEKLAPRLLEAEVIVDP